LLAGLAGWVVYWSDITWEIPGNWSGLRPVSVHLIAVGWLTQLIFAVIYWMFPIISRENPHGSTWIGWFGFACLNLGLLARAFFETGMFQGLPEAAHRGLVGSAILQWSGATAWVVISWGRIRERAGTGKAH
ncbi:MAG TPA: hypothetical protein VJZ27_12450, partial [Aggregatilineales bacterium]|nr:hypothetical protein [Aggregatilineales bacterium]